MKKKLNNLVEDIYNVLDSLTEGNELNISEEMFEEFGKDMTDALRHWATPQNVEGKPVLRMSNVGRPERRLWFDTHTQSDTTEKLQPSTQIKFLYGHLLEVLMLFFVKLSGHKLTSQQKEITVSGIKGHMDCMIDGEVVDVKTASGYSFKKFKEGTLAEDDAFGYLSQLAGYEAAEKTNSGGFLVMNKETGELTMFVPDDMDKPNIKSKIKKVKNIIASDSPPDFCYQPIPEGKAGNMKVARGCSWCPHKFECHKMLTMGKDYVYLITQKDLYILQKLLVNLTWRKSDERKKI